MNRLTIELDRLYGRAPGATVAATAGVGSDLRALVLAVVLPSGWEQLAAVWRGVQSDLDLPAPGIAVSGLDALQLWFSLASPVPPAAGDRFLQGLRRRYLPDIAASRVRLFAAGEFPVAPFVETGPQRWSAFVSPDLAAVFEETPWLDIPPTDDGQAALLRALEPIRPAAFEAALIGLGAAEDALPAAAAPGERAGSAAPAVGLRETDPARFLSGVMTDETVPLALRIEAAAILLRHAGRAPTA